MVLSAEQLELTPRSVELLAQLPEPQIVFKHLMLWYAVDARKCALVIVTGADGLMWCECALVVWRRRGRRRSRSKLCVACIASRSC